MKLTRIGVDIAKQVFQLHGTDRHEQADMASPLATRALATGVAVRWPSRAARSAWKPAVVPIIGRVSCRRAAIA